MRDERVRFTQIVVLNFPLFTFFPLHINFFFSPSSHYPPPPAAIYSASYIPSRRLFSRIECRRLYKKKNSERLRDVNEPIKCWLQTERKEIYKKSKEKQENRYAQHKEMN